MRTPSFSRGFTLIELMIAIGIAVLLMMQAAPSFTTFLRNSEIRSTAESIANGLRTARAEATHRNVPITFTFIAGGGDPSWAINAFSLTTTSLIQPPIQQYSKLEAGRNAKVATTPGGAISVTFNGLGRIISPSPLATPNLQRLDVGSIVAGEARTLRVYVDDVHGIRMCDPDPALAGQVPPNPKAC